MTAKVTFFIYNHTFLLLSLNNVKEVRQKKVLDTPPLVL